MSMDIENMTHDEIQQRLAEIDTELRGENADVASLSAEVDALQTRRDALKAEAEERKQTMQKVAEMTTAPVVDKIDMVEEKEERKENMELEERNAKIDALAEYIKGRATEEQRALLTTNATNGTVAISDIVDGWIWTDWDRSPILSRVRKAYVRGNYKVGYEASATGAVLHTEGDLTAPAEEVLTLAYIDFIAQYYKKWITVSDSVLALRGQEFMDYLMREFGHQLALALENAVVAELNTSTLTANVTHAIDGDAVLMGLARLSDEATNPVVIMSKATYASIKSIRTTAGNRIEDPFEGLEVLFNNTATGVYVGDLDGVVANFPEGEDFKFIVDDRSMAEHDMIKIVGKIMAAIHLVRPNGFAHVKTA